MLRFGFLHSGVVRITLFYSDTGGQKVYANNNSSYYWGLKDRYILPWARYPCIWGQQTPIYAQRWLSSASYMVVRAVHQSNCSYGRIAPSLQEKHLHGVPMRQFSASYPPVKNMLDIFCILVVTFAAKYGTCISDSLIQEMLAAGKS